MVKTSPSNAGGVGSIPNGGAKILHALWPKKNPNIKKKQYCNKFNKKDFKNVHIKKKGKTSLKKEGRGESEPQETATLWQYTTASVKALYCSALH